MNEDLKPFLPLSPAALHILLCLSAESRHKYAIMRQVARQILLQGEKILVLDGRGILHRLNSDGSNDPAFRVPAFKVYSH